MQRLKRALITSLILSTGAVLFYLTPYGQKLEENYGLALLFKMRGSRTPPAAAVIVNIDDDSARKLDLPGDFSNWPRSVHARLVDQLSSFGATAIAFDIHFAGERDAKDDLLFAESMRRSKKVILVEKLHHRSIGLASSPERAAVVEMDIIAPPLRIFSESALALAPFPLPKRPVRVNKAWLFKKSSGEIPTLPGVVYQVASLNQLHHLLNVLASRKDVEAGNVPQTIEEALGSVGLTETMRRLRVHLKKNADGDGLNAEEWWSYLEGLEKTERDKVQALLSFYSGDGLTTIDYYGPPASHTTVSCGDILSATGAEKRVLARKIAGKAVFVGAAKQSWSNQKDGFYTIFTRADGLDLSGVEIAATIYANLHEKRSVSQLGKLPSILLLVVSGLAFCLTSYLLSPLWAGLLLIVAVSSGLAVSLAAFFNSGLWLPLILPLTVIPLLSFFSATIVNYLGVRKEKKNISTALGFYLPDDVVAELSKDLSFISKGKKGVHATCMMTDAENYTTVSEKLTPEQLSHHMKEYYGHLFRQVKANNGAVCNVIGDSMLAIWPSVQEDASLRESGCRAAVSIILEVRKFNAANQANPLPTRIGLHTGYLLMDNIGAEDHFEYAPVGDIVNTASRIESLNKKLKTNILASQHTLEYSSNIASREIGLFLFSGKSEPVNIHQIFVDEREAELWTSLYPEAFPEALDLFRAGKWQEAESAFAHCLSLKADDGPARFYHRLCREYQLRPPGNEFIGLVHTLK